MHDGHEDANQRQQRLDAFRDKLKQLTDLELITLSSLARHGTVRLEEEWDLIVEQIAARKSEKK